MRRIRGSDMEHLDNAWTHKLPGGGKKIGKIDKRLNEIGIKKEIRYIWKYCENGEFAQI